MLKHPEKFSYEDVKQKISQIADPLDHSLAAFTYATGARVSEINQVTKGDIIKEDTGTYLYIHCPVLKKKNQRKATRKALVRMDETWLVTPIMDRVNSFKKDDAVLFDYNRMFIYRHLVASTGWNPHGFRKLRATHLRKYFGFDAYKLKEFFEWASIEPSAYYVKLDPKEIMY